MKKTLYRQCPVCGATEERLISSHHSLLPKKHPRAATFDVVIYDECTFAVSDTPPSQ